MLNIVCNTSHDIHIREYYNYVVSLFKGLDAYYNVIIGNYNYEFNNSYKTLRIDIQCEHTLVKEGGRGSENSIKGAIPLGDDFYLVRIGNLDYFRKIDGIIEYSLPNIANIKSIDNYKDIVDKIIYVAPTLYDNVDYGELDKRDRDCITMFSNIYEQRRYNILCYLLKSGINVENINGVFDKNELRNIYHQTKIMINVHQTDHHDTFEELRIIPAVMSGVLIISENVPLKEIIPYSEYIMKS